jgi:hypothetical protein
MAIVKFPSRRSTRRTRRCHQRDAITMNKWMDIVIPDSTMLADDVSVKVSPRVESNVTMMMSVARKKSGRGISLAANDTIFLSRTRKRHSFKKEAISTSHFSHTKHPLTANPAINQHSPLLPTSLSCIFAPTYFASAS